MGEPHAYCISIFICAIERAQPQDSISKIREIVRKSEQQGGTKLIMWGLWVIFVWNELMTLPVSTNVNTLLSQ